MGQSRRYGEIGSLVSLSIPNHREIAKGTLRKLIRLAGMSIDEFTQLLLP